MRVERTLVGFLCALMAASSGCGGRLAYNLPPASRLMEPGPGVGGPGPGVIPPAGNPYGIYGGAVGRFGGGAVGGPVASHNAAGLGATLATNRTVPTPSRVSAADQGIVQASYSGGCDGDCMCDGGGIGGAILAGPAGFARPGTEEAYAGADCMSGMAPGGMATSQIAFLGEEGVQIAWDVSGNGAFDSTMLTIPGRQDFYQGGIYRLKVTNIPGRVGVDIYPTLEVAPVTPRTDAYLAHSPIPVQFTTEDFDQVLSGNFVTKVIYLPDPEFQELALAGVETLVSTRLDPGVDPIAEADRRGSILAILRMGNKDLEPGLNDAYGPEQVVPAGFVTPAAAIGDRSGVSRTSFNRALGANQPQATGQLMPAQYGEACDSGCSDGSCGAGYGGGSAANMPMGVPTGGFAPPAMPPNYLAGAPQWGMPITGTPIGLPGPPHIPLGTPAGLQKHVMRNRTRVMMPPPVSQVKVTVKQRPGLNYPRPVNNVHINETQREPLRLIPSWVSGIFDHSGNGAGHGGAYGDPNCQ